MHSKKERMKLKIKRRTDLEQFVRGHAAMIGDYYFLPLAFKMDGLEFSAEHVKDLPETAKLFFKKHFRDESDYSRKPEVL